MNAFKSIVLAALLFSSGLANANATYIDTSKCTADKGCGGACITQGKVGTCGYKDPKMKWIYTAKKAIRNYNYGGQNNFGTFPEIPILHPIYPPIICKCVPLPEVEFELLDWPNDVVYEE